MDGAFGQMGRAQSAHQQVWVESGFGYGVIGADLHVFGDGRPVYLLKEAGGRKGLRLAVDGSGLPAQPSHLLNARHAVVDFTGRDGEVDDLIAWRDGGGRAVRWLHAPGGQGKTRLASHVAGLAARDGWKVIVAEHTSARVVDDKETSYDLRVGAACGLLMLVDYADRWPLAHLTWLFNNKVLNQNVPVRVLLVARNEHVWPALRHALTGASWPPEDCTSHSLGALPSARDARGSMFVAARDCFARRYGLPEAAAIGVPDWLEREEFGLTLTVHMAALVAVDRHARSAPQPEAPREGMMALTAYLLERESLHWHTLHGTVDTLAGGRTAFNTPPTQMRRTVFTASLTGPMGYRDARAALDAVGVGGDADRVLTDHTFCYPPTDPRTALEPLYPDRLAEDFLALCLPGHDLPDHTPDAWADGTPEVLLAPSTRDGVLPPYAARAITFLTAASERWPHLISTLERLERLLPQDPRDAAGDLTVAAAGLADRLARHRLPTVTDPAARAELHDSLGRWLNQANREEEAAAALREARRLYHTLAAADPQVFEEKLAQATLLLAQNLALMGFMCSPDELAQMPLSAGGDALRPARARPDEALAALREAVEIFRRLAHDNPAEHQEDLGAALTLAAVFGPNLGAADESLALARECVDIVRWMMREDAGENASTMSVALANLAGNLVASEPEQATALASEAVDGLRRLARDDPAEHEETLQSVLALQAATLLRQGRAEPALASLNEAVRVGRRTAQREGSDDRDAWEESVFLTFGLMWMQGSEDDTAVGLATAMQVLHREARANPAVSGSTLLNVFFATDGMLRRLERWELVLGGQRDVIGFLRSSDDDALRYDYLNGILGATGCILAMLGRWDEALDVVGEIAEEMQREGVGDGLLEDCLAGALRMVATDGAGLAQDEDVYENLAQDKTVAMLTRIAAAYRKRSCGDARERDQGLAATLKMLSEALWILGRPWESLAASAEAVEIRRRLALGGTAEHHGYLALALKRHAEKSERVGQHSEAAAVAEEAVNIYRLLAWDDFARRGPALAATLHLLAVNLWRSSPARALFLEHQAVEMLGRLARDEPAAHEPNLVIVLDTMAKYLHELGRGEEARVAEDQAAEVRGRLVARGDTPP
ncbi:hypothetical protein ACXZ65_38035 [Streptomyces aculeolatus]